MYCTERCCSRLLASNAMVHRRSLDHGCGSSLYMRLGGVLTYPFGTDRATCVIVQKIELCEIFLTLSSLCLERQGREKKRGVKSRKPRSYRISYDHLASYSFPAIFQYLILHRRASDAPKTVPGPISYTPNPTSHQSALHLDVHRLAHPPLPPRAQMRPIPETAQL